MRITFQGVEDGLEHCAKWFAEKSVVTRKAGDAILAAKLAALQFLAQSAHEYIQNRLYEDDVEGDAPETRRIPDKVSK